MYENFGEVVRQHTREPAGAATVALARAHVVVGGGEPAAASADAGSDAEGGQRLTNEVPPPHSSVKKLSALAGNHVTKVSKQRAAASGAMCAAVEC